MDDPRLTPITTRGRGRPRVAEPRTTLCTWLDAKHYDQIVRMATKEDKSVSALVREFIVLRLK
jgi:hypothetical protein